MFASLSQSNFQLKSETNSDIENSAKLLLIPGRITAATNIPQGAITTAIDSKSLSGPHDIMQLAVQTNRNGIIDLEPSSKQIWSKSLHWIRALRLSEDCHSYNVQLQLQKSAQDQKLILQATKPINAGQELTLWFSEEILNFLQMVFLTPANIQGQKKYVCVRCSASYESPNPLKLHISLGCGKKSISDFWEMLKNNLSESWKHSINPKVSTEFTFRLTPNSSSVKQKISPKTVEDPAPTAKSSISELPQDFSTSTLRAEENPAKVLYRPYSEPSAIYSSAFKPFNKAENDDKAKQRSVPESLQCWPNFVLTQNIYTQSNLFARNRANTDDEAQIETLVSSLGKSKDGHVCLYCGKCYSRKYGLKIHIRTHTGYKPLKCKFCLRPFGDPSNLNKHVRLHAEGDTPYRCDLCGKILVRRRDLERHLKSRHMSEMHPGRSIAEEQTNSEQCATDEDTEDLSVDR